uniref:Uncharacterized protein n=1 Tax=Setaria viridis TaxID=4556 RepID=A0A4U6VSC1_SETVI|nr:hypothetical protein SEVIR_2G152600v2 [Setaria viridis]
MPCTSSSQATTPLATEAPPAAPSAAATAPSAIEAPPAASSVVAAPPAAPSATMTFIPELVLIRALDQSHLSCFTAPSARPSAWFRPRRSDPSVLRFSPDPGELSPPSDPSNPPQTSVLSTGGPARSFPQILHDRRTRVACPLQSLPAAWLVFSDACRSVLSLASDQVGSRALFPNGSGSPSAPLSAEPRLPRPSSRRQIPAQSPMSPVFSVPSATVAPPGLRYTTIPPPPTPTAAATAPFPALSEAARQSVAPRSPARPQLPVFSPVRPRF